MCSNECFSKSLAMGRFAPGAPISDSERQQGVPHSKDSGVKTDILDSDPVAATENSAS